MAASPAARPYATVVLAMTADGKISDVGRSGQTFGSKSDYRHLEKQVALSDAVLMGAGTLRSGETAMRVMSDEWLKARQADGKPPQPVQLVCTRSGSISPDLTFFRQPIPRWLLTTTAGGQFWRDRPEFDRVLCFDGDDGGVDFVAAFAELHRHGLERLAVLGGGSLIAQLCDRGLLDELRLTVCPLLFGGQDAPTPLDGAGFSRDRAPKLELLSAEEIEQEVFLSYRLLRE